MKEYSINEKQFIAHERPIVEIESIEFENYDFSAFKKHSGIYTPISFVSSQAMNCSEKDICECMRMKIHMRDRGADYEQKFITFNDFGILCYDSDLSFELKPPMKIFKSIADKDGRFSLSVPIWLGPSISELETILDRLKIDESAFSFFNVSVSNQFVTESFNINGKMGVVAENNQFEKDSVLYSLCNLVFENNGNSSDVDEENVILLD